MNSSLLKSVIDLVETFKLEEKNYRHDVLGFQQWIADRMLSKSNSTTVTWEGKEKGRSAESVINTSLFRLNRYAKNYSKAAIYNSAFTTQEEFIYLITLNSYGAMNKIELIKKNIQDKPTGIQIINRLIHQGWVKQYDSTTDKRSKIIAITAKGKQTLDKQMNKIRLATKLVTGDLNAHEKIDLIRLLSKLEHFHAEIFEQQYSYAELLNRVKKDHLTA